MRARPGHLDLPLGEDDYWPYKVMLVSQQPSPLLGGVEDTRPIDPNGRIGSVRAPSRSRC